MSANPAIRTINGKGTPRVITETDVVLQSTNVSFFVDGNGRYVADFSSNPDPVDAVQAGMRLSSVAVISGQPNKPIYARITAVDEGNYLLYLDAWVPTVPAGTSTAQVDGWVIDLPHCQEITETFEADQNIHNLWRNRIVSKFFGWKYSCVLDYSGYIKPDTIVDARYMLSKDTNESMILIPHKDKPEFQYNVIFDQPINISPFGIAPGYRKLIFGFKGRETVATLPIAATGYGFGYATNYGVQY